MMAVDNPVVISDAFGEEYTFWTDALAVVFDTNLRTSPMTAFNQAVEDGVIDAVIDQAGMVTVTYLDGEGARLTKSSDRDGDSGTWV